MKAGIARIRCRLSGHQLNHERPAFREPFGSFYGEGDRRNALWYEWKHLARCNCRKYQFIHQGIPYVGQSA